MTQDPNEPVRVKVKTDKYQVTYFADRDEFLLVISAPLRSGNVLIERHEIYLDGDIVRQMAEVLPPRDPETVH